MAGIPSVGGIASIQFQTELTARVASIQKDAVEQQGDLAIQLIESATVDTGQNLNIRI